jgi:Tfp pilus assembly protein PilW
VIARPGARGASLLEVVIASALALAAIAGFIAELAAVSRARRDAALRAEAQAEADRAFDLLANDLREASLATLAAPAAGSTASGARFRRVTGFHEDRASGVPAPVLAESETVWELAADGTLTRREGALAVAVCRGVRRLELARDGAKAAVRVLLEVARTGAELDRASGAPTRHTGEIRAEVLVASD